jgi:hypothetical protein
MSVSGGLGMSNWVSLTQNANILLIVVVVVLSASTLVSFIFDYYMSKAVKEYDLPSLGATRILSIPTSISCIIVIYELHQLASTLSGLAGYPPSYIYAQFQGSMRTLNTVVTIAFLISLAFMIPFAGELRSKLGGLQVWIQAPALFVITILMIEVLSQPGISGMPTVAAVVSSYVLACLLILPPTKKFSNIARDFKLERRVATVVTGSMMVITLLLYMPLLWLSVALLLFGTEASLFATKLSELAGKGAKRIGLCL